MPKPEWGVKRICTSCGVRFYDLLRNPVVCPSCGAEVDITVLAKPKRIKAGAAQKVAAKPVPIDDDDLIEDEDDLVEDEDEDEEDVVDDIPVVIAEDEDEAEDDDEADVVVVDDDIEDFEDEVLIEEVEDDIDDVAGDDIVKL
jgi:uncharacterized protein (TIGR02300 family)